MDQPLKLELDRSAKTPLTEQIRKGISTAIESGVLAPGARLPSWLDLAAQLGVARGTVRTAYEKLSAAQLIVASRAGGTRVADRPAAIARVEQPPDPGSFLERYLEMTAGPAIFQMGVPALETFAATLFARIRSQAVRAESSAPAIYPDPRGELDLRREIAGYLAVARGIECSPSEVIITGGYASGLGLTLVVVTAGQQAPLGPTLSLARRLRLLDWAAQTQAWVIEDDYLSGLRLNGRAAPALASLDRAGRVVHIGSFSKTISPALRLGFLVAPPALASCFAEVAACLAPPPGPALQLATAEFMRDGHYMRHLRRTKRVYSAQRDALLECLPHAGEAGVAGLAVLLRLPDARRTLLSRGRRWHSGWPRHRSPSGMRRRSPQGPACF
ncbi:transcriptional regulator, GntR family with aminotransferase domain [Sinorhizobium meliloti AK83]|nr:transcriptional regulator, GntR family with aminotransferase domain [Sinorhizobium meliloti AK83]